MKILNPHILHMLEGFFTLDAAHLFLNRGSVKHIYMSYASSWTIEILCVLQPVRGLQHSLLD